MEEPAHCATSKETKTSKVLSNNAQKKLNQEKRKATRKLLAQEELRKRTSKNSTSQNEKPASVYSLSRKVGKAGRAKAARQHPGMVIPEHIDYRERKLLNATPEQNQVIQFLEELETQCRIRHRPELIERRLIPMDCHGDYDPQEYEEGCCVKVVKNEAGNLSLRSKNLSMFSMDLFQHANINYQNLTTLDLSRNNLWSLPNIDKLSCLTSLNLSRNLFQDIPLNIGKLTKLKLLDVTHNLLNGSSLDLKHLNKISNLEIVDIRFNAKCNKSSFETQLKSMLPSKVELRITIPWYKGKVYPEGTYVGNSASERDANILRSQLEPWGTTALRRRLIADFGFPPTDPAIFHRAMVMRQLLHCYSEEQQMQQTFNKSITESLSTSSSSSSSPSSSGSQTTTNNFSDPETTSNGRCHIRIDGTPVSAAIREKIMKEIKSWSDAGKYSNANHSRERPSVKASSYMILHSADQMLRLSAKKAVKALDKFKRHENIWNYGMEALKEVDPEFADRVTAIAVTHNFSGSPHIDKQNTGPFYGLSLGNFADGQGGIRVECSARVVCDVNTKNRLGKVDGRYPHWVAPYHPSCERYSLIYYRTSGEIDSVCGAIFKIPN